MPRAGVAPNAVGFDGSAGFEIERDSTMGPSGRESVFMTKGV